MTQARTGSAIGCKRTIDIEAYGSPVPNLMVPTADESIILLEKEPDGYRNRDIETARKRKRSKYLNSLWIDPEDRKKRKLRRTPRLIDISEDDDLLDTEYAAFLKTTGDNKS